MMEKWSDLQSMKGLNGGEFVRSTGGTIEAINRKIEFLTIECKSKKKKKISEL